MENVAVILVDWAVYDTRKLTNDGLDHRHLLPFQVLSGALSSNESF